MNFENMLVPKSVSGLPHYYGDYVRRFYLAVCIILLIAQPLYPGLYPFNSFIAIGLILGLVLLAAILNPAQYVAIATDAVASALGLLVFGYFALQSIDGGINIDAPFVIHQAVAICFLFAFYYSVKSVRAKKLEQEQK